MVRSAKLLTSQLGLAQSGGLVWSAISYLFVVNGDSRGADRHRCPCSSGEHSSVQCSAHSTGCGQSKGSGLVLNWSFFSLATGVLLRPRGGTLNAARR